MRPATDLNLVLEEALEHYDSFSLLWRQERKAGDAGWEIQEALRPYLLKQCHTDEWPGTKIYYGTELLCTYQVNPASLSILRTAENLFSLFAEDGPEDLAFYSKGMVKFGSISHEREAWYET